MFAVCKFPDESGDRFIIYDETEFKTDEFGLVKDEEIKSKEELDNYKYYPILSLNDYLLRALNPKARTVTHTLGELGINSWFDLLFEYNLITLKKSNLSKRQRALVELRCNQIRFLLDKLSNNTDEEQSSNNEDSESVE